MQILRVNSCTYTTTTSGRAAHCIIVRFHTYRDRSVSYPHFSRHLTFLFLYCPTTLIPCFDIFAFLLFIYRNIVFLRYRTKVEHRHCSTFTALLLIKCLATDAYIYILWVFALRVYISNRTHSILYLLAYDTINR